MTAEKCVKGRIRLQRRLLCEVMIVKKRTLYFLGASMAGILALCVTVFMGMFHFMEAQNRDTMNEVSQLYMSEMSKQIASHFGSIMDIRLSMVRAVINRTPPENYTEYVPELEEELTLSGQVRGFSYLALYGEDGATDIIYGEPISIADEIPFREDLMQEDKKLVVGETDAGDTVMLFVTQADYPMKNGKTSLMLVAGLPIGYLNYTMNNDREDSMVYFDIVRRDGSFITHNADPAAENCFDRLLEGSYEDKTAEQAVEELKQAISEGKDYSVIATIGEQRRNIYARPLRNSEWYLMTVMFHRNFDTAVTRLGHRHLGDALIASVIILSAILAAFVIYFRMSLRHMLELTEAKKKEGRENKAKSEFLFNMSHDIRTRMNGIAGMTAIATANVDRPEIVRDCLGKITTSSTHLQELISDVLDMSKMESGDFVLGTEQISLRDAMEAVVSVIMPQVKAKKQAFDVIISDIEAEEVCSDGTRLNQILINLLSNAVKFTPEGGCIDMTVSQEDSPRGANFVRTHMAVRDTGIGMTEEFQKKIYDSFARADDKRAERAEGTGLGLAITKHIVDKMEGTIELKSEPGKGSEFHVTLDLERAPVWEKDMALPAWNVLVVDDNEQIGRAAVGSLNALGAHAESAPDGAGAVELVRTRHQEHRDYKIVILDRELPDMDGIETARQIRGAVENNVPILSISAYDWSDIEEEAREAGIDGFISKPLFKSTLYHGLIGFAESAEDAPTAQEDAEKERIFDGKRLLVAEDFEINWEIIEALLSVHGFILERAENGQVCVEKYRASEPGFYHAILMDLRMPVMNGYEAAEAIRSSGREDSDVPIIAMTADTFSEDIQHCLECGMNSHVAKPINLNELLNNLKKYIFG